MKTLLKALCFLLLLQFTPIAELSAQTDFRKGYVLTNSKDTIKGFVLYSGGSLHSKCEFKTSLDAKATKYLPGEIESYRFEEGKFFITKRLSQKDSISYFLEYLIKGKLNVYYMRDGHDRYFVEKENERLVELSEEEKVVENKDFITYIPRNLFKGKLTAILVDRMQMQNEIQLTQLTHKSLIKLAKSYHDAVCEGDKCIIFERKSKKVIFNFGFQAGLNLNFLNFGESIETSYEPGMQIGVRFEMSRFVSWDEKIGLNLDANIIQLNNLNLKHFTNGNLVDLYKVDCQATILQLPFDINYEFDLKKIKPYFGVGFINSFVLNQNKEFKLDLFWNEYGQTIPTYSYGLDLKIGTKFQLSNKKNLYVEGHFEKLMNISPFSFLALYTNSYSFLLGYSF